jgi:hypothetical protein
VITTLWSLKELKKQISKNIQNKEKEKERRKEFYLKDLYIIKRLKIFI